MIVCVCHRVSEADIREAVREGDRCLDALGRRLGVGTGCGSCLDYARDLIDESGHSGPSFGYPAAVPLPSPA